MVKVLSKAGDSLADTYDVEGSIAGIEQLETRDLGIVHEMGATVFAERFGGRVRRATTGNILQSTTWDLFITDMPATPSRIFGVSIVTTQAGRVSNAAVMAHDSINLREIPLVIWDSGEPNITARFQENGAAAANINFLVSSLNLENLPSMLIGAGQRNTIDQIAFRGLTTAFGAGNVAITCLVYVAAADLGGVSSRGLPIPSW